MAARKPLPTGKEWRDHIEPVELYHSPLPEVGKPEGAATVEPANKTIKVRDLSPPIYHILDGENRVCRSQSVFCVVDPAAI